MAWVRKVAWNLATSRRRRQRTALAFLRRYRERHVPGPTPDRVALTAACRVGVDLINQAVAFRLDGVTVHMIGAVARRTRRIDRSTIRCGLSSTSRGTMGGQGSPFAQVGGPTSFRAPATIHLSASSGPVHFDAASSGFRDLRLTPPVVVVPASKAARFTELHALARQEQSRSR